MKYYNKCFESEMSSNLDNVSGSGSSGLMTGSTLSGRKVGSPR